MTYEEVHKKLQELEERKEIDEAMELVAKYNKPAMDLFEESLSKYTDRTIRRHMANVDLFLNDYNTYYEFKIWEDAWIEASSFLGDFFIHKCMWSTPENIKTTATSIKKFYKCMVDHGLFPLEKYQEMCRVIKACMPRWQEDCARFNNFDEDYDEFDYFQRERQRNDIRRST